MAKLPICEVGWNCGDSCISKRKRCLKYLSGESVSSLDSYSDLITAREFSDINEKMLKNLASDADSFLKDKKANRLDIGSDKTAKKKLLEEENQAWIYLRTFRYKERLAKDSENKDEVSRLTELLQKLAVGDKKSYDVARVELENRIETQRKIKQVESFVVETQKTSEIQDFSKDERAKLANDHQKNLYGIIIGEKDGRKPEEIKDGDNLIAEKNDNRWQKPKIAKLKKMGLNSNEANGVASWISSSTYRRMNSAIYSGDEDKFGKAAGIRALQGFRKLPAYTHKELETTRLKMGKDSSPYHSLLEPGRLRRGLDGIDDVDSFLKPFEEALESGKVYKEPTFFATTARKDISFTSNPQILFEIKSKSDGTGQGRAVDQYKNSAFEGEVVFPPFSKFKVVEIVRKGKKVQIKLEEI